MSYHDQIHNISPIHPPPPCIHELQATIMSFTNDYSIDHIYELHTFKTTTSKQIEALWAY